MFFSSPCLYELCPPNIDSRDRDLRGCHSREYPRITDMCRVEVRRNEDRPKSTDYGK